MIDSSSEAADREIPIAGPWISELELDYVRDAAANAWYGGAGDYVIKFERSFASYAQRLAGISLPSCTAGIHLALAGLGIGPDDEVIVPDLTWIATAAPISYVGATPVFVDVDPHTWCISVEAVRSALTKRTRAIIAVDLYGGMPEMDELASLAAESGVPLIEDAAEAVGSRWKGRPAGSFGKASVFSFHGSKTLTTGEGGMVVTDDEDLYRRILVLADHGRPPGDTDFLNAEVAFKYKMSALQAACGLAQLERLDALVQKKRTIFEWYRQSLGQLDELILNSEPEGVFNTYWMTTCLIDDRMSIPIKDLRYELKRKGISTRPFFQPLSSLPAYRGLPQAQLASERNEVSYRLAPHGLNLPSALSLEKPDVERVSSALMEAIDKLSTAKKSLRE